jgi:hypothetical protein
VQPEQTCQGSSLSCPQLFHARADSCWAGTPFAGVLVFPVSHDCKCRIWPRAGWMPSTETTHLHTSRDPDHSGGGADTSASPAQVGFQSPRLRYLSPIFLSRDQLSLENQLTLHPEQGAQIVSEPPRGSAQSRMTPDRLESPCPLILLNPSNVNMETG